MHTSLAVVLPAFLAAAAPGWCQEVPPAPKENQKTTRTLVTKACCSCLESLKLVVQNNGPHQTSSSLVPEVNPDEPNDPVMVVRPGGRSPSNKFQVVIGFSTKVSDTQGNMTLQWFERAERVPSIYQTAGLKPDEWNDVQEALTTSQAQVRKKDGRPPKPGDRPRDLTTVAAYVNSRDGGTATYWPNQYLNKKAKECAVPHTSVYIEDEPSAFKPRKLEFHIVVKDPDNCGCTDPKTLELYATQLIRSKSGSATDDADTGLSRMYGPDGELKREGEIIGQAPDAPKPKLP